MTVYYLTVTCDDNNTYHCHQTSINVDRHRKQDGGRQTGSSYSSGPVTDRISIPETNHVFKVVEFKAITYNSGRHRPTPETRWRPPKPEVVKAPKVSRICALFQRQISGFRLRPFERRPSCTRPTSSYAENPRFSLCLNNRCRN